MDPNDIGEGIAEAKALSEMIDQAYEQGGPAAILDLMTFCGNNVFIVTKDQFKEWCGLGRAGIKIETFGAPGGLGVKIEQVERKVNGTGSCE